MKTFLPIASLLIIILLLGLSFDQMFNQPVSLQYTITKVLLIK